MRFDDIPDYWKEHLEGHWDKEARSHWGDIQNYFEAWDSEQYLFLADASARAHGETLDEAMMPDSAFSIAYADWAQEDFDRYSWEYANLLYEAGYFDSPEDAYDYYHDD